MVESVKVAIRCNCGAAWYLLVATIVLPERTSVWQQACDCGMLPDSLICAMHLQYGCSCAVIVRPGILQASNGAAVQRTVRSERAMAVVQRRMI